MRRSISNRRGTISTSSASALLFLLSLVPVAGQDYIDDKLLLRSFETGFAEVRRTGRGLSAHEVRKQLRREHSFEGTVAPAAEISGKSTPEVYRKAKAASILVGHLYLCDDCDRLHGSPAGGVLIGGGLALTNYHVLEFPRAQVFGAMTSDATLLPIVEVVASSKKFDLALIRLEGAEDLPSLPLAKSADVGDPVFVVSHPDAHFYTLSTGYISRFYVAPRDKVRRMQITADFARGSSGSGVLNRNGALTGLVASTNSIYYTQERDRQEDLQMVVKSCVPLESIRAFLSAK